MEWWKTHVTIMAAIKPMQFSLCFGHLFEAFSDDAGRGWTMVTFEVFCMFVRVTSVVVIVVVLLRPLSVGWKKRISRDTNVVVLQSHAIKIDLLQPFWFYASRIYGVSPSFAATLFLSHEVQSIRTRSSLQQNLFFFWSRRLHKTD